MFSLRFLIRIKEIEDSLLGLRECSVNKGSVSQGKLKNLSHWCVLQFLTL